MQKSTGGKEKAKAQWKVIASLGVCSLEVFHKPSAMIKLPRCRLRNILEKRDCWKPDLDYEHNVCKIESSRYRIYFLTTCPSTDLNTGFLKFRVPKTDVFFRIKRCIVFN